MKGFWLFNVIWRLDDKFTYLIVKEQCSYQIIIGMVTKLCFLCFIRFFSLFWGTYQVDVSQLEMVIAGYIYNYVINSTVNISHGPSDPSVAYLFKLLMSCLSSRDEGAVL